MPAPAFNRPWAPRVFNAKARRRFALNRTVALATYLGREPTDIEMLVIQRLIELEWGLRRDDARLARGERLAEWELKARTEAETALRVGLAWLDRAPRKKRETPAPDWRDQLTGIHGQHKRKGHHAT